MRNRPPVDSFAYLVKNENADWLQDLPGVEGVGVGTHYPGERPHHMWAYVSDMALARRLLPRQIAGVPIMLKRTEPVRSFSMSSQLVALPNFPILGGASIGAHSNRLNAEVTGTLGMLVRDSQGGYQFLGCNHVLCGISTHENPVASIGNPIYSPGAYFGGDPSVGTIATLSSWSQISETADNDSEWALAKNLLTDQSQFDNRLLGIDGNPVGHGAPWPGTTVMKSGALSGVTVGRIIDVDSQIDVSYESLFQATYDHQIIVDNGGDYSFSKPGDSGSIVFAKGADGVSLIAVGQVIGGSSSVVVVSPMTTIVAASGISSLPLVTLSEPPPQEAAMSPLSLGILAFMGATSYILGRHVKW